MIILLAYVNIIIYIPIIVNIIKQKTEGYKSFRLIHYILDIFNISLAFSKVLSVITSDPIILANS